MLGGFAERHQLSREQATRLGAAFGGGIAGTAQTCGAVTGALMVLGLAHGSPSATDKESKKKTYAASRQLLSGFQARHGSVVCRELLGIDIATREGLEAAMRSGVFKARCPVFVRDAAEITSTLL